VLSRALNTPWWWRALYAIATASTAFGLTILLRLHDRPYLLAMVAVVLSALRGGFGAGLLCGGFSAALTIYYLLPPPGGLSLPSRVEAYEILIFSVTAAIVSLLAARHRRAQLALETTLSSIAEGVIVTDDEGRVAFLNEVGERLTGWRLREAAGRPVAEVFQVVHEETRTPVPDPIERTLREGTPARPGNHRVLIARDGREAPISDSTAAMKDRDGHPIGAVLVFRDASRERAIERGLAQQAAEREELLERERRARGEAERANRLKDEFLATLSHELRTPLNAVLGWSHMLTRRQLTAEQEKQALAAIYRNAQAQARLVEDVLDLSRIVTGRMALASEQVDVSEVARSTAESFTAALAARRQELCLDLADGATVVGDPHRFRQIVWNLLSNATKFTPEGGRIAIQVSTDDAYVHLTVTDNGQGIDPAFLPYVFDRFRQGDSSSTRGHGGLGLGLALVRHLVEAHGGTATASSDGPGLGTAIRLSVPAARPGTGVPGGGGVEHAAAL
jgi:PAS domain S-box-containing protein